MKIIGESERVFLSISETAKIFGVSPKTLKKWLTDPVEKNRHIPELTPLQFPESWLFRLEEVQAALERIYKIQISAGAVLDLLQL